MELKGVFLVLIMVILLIAGNAIADDCYMNCTASCPTPTTRECFKNCGNQCSGSTGDLAQKTKGHQHHCKHRCSHHCVKYRNGTHPRPLSLYHFNFFFLCDKNVLNCIFFIADQKKMERCMHHCTTNCHIKAPGPSPSSQ